MSKLVRNISLMLIIGLVGVSSLALAKTELYFTLYPGDFEYWWESRIEAFNKKHPDVEVVVEYLKSPGEKVTSMLLGGTPPDVSYVMWRDSIGWVVEDLYLDLYPLIEADPDLDLADFLPQSLQYYEWGGKLTAMPINPDVGVLFYNRDLFAGGGLLEPVQHYGQGNWTWETFLWNARKLTISNAAGGTDQYGYGIDNGWEPSFGTWLYSNGARIFNEDRTESLLHEPEAIEALEWLTALNHTYGVTTGSLGIMSNTAAMATGPVPFGEEAFAVGIKNGVVPMPGRDMGVPATHVMLGPGLMIFKDSLHKDLAWDFIKECASHEGMEELARFTGRLPSRLSAFGAWQDYYRQYTANSGLVLDAVMNSLWMPYCPQWPDVLKVIQREISVAWHGLKPAGMAAEEMTRRINVFLDN